MLSNRKFLIVIILILLTFTFVGSPFTISRSLQVLRNLGHIVLFSLLAIYIFKNLLFFKRKKIHTQIFILVIITTLLSFVIELSQYIFAIGTFDFADIRRNFIGAAIGFVLYAKIKGRKLVIFLRVLVLLFVFVEAIPFMKAITDEFRSIKEIPILSDFESDLELSRWSGDEPFTRSSEKVKHGSSALKMTFGTSKYSGVALKYFPEDWSIYRYLKYNIYYNGPDTLRFTCRIHDKKHIIGPQVYNDRFNCRYFLVNGWNEISVPLNNVKNAPQNRQMDLTEIKGFAIFTVDLQKREDVYLDFVHLE